MCSHLACGTEGLRSPTARSPQCPSLAWPRQGPYPPMRLPALNLQAGQTTGIGCSSGMLTTRSLADVTHGARTRTFTTRSLADVTHGARTRHRRVHSRLRRSRPDTAHWFRSEEHTSELQSLRHLVCRLLL